MRAPRWVPVVLVGPAVLVMAAACLYPVLSALRLGLYDWSIGTAWAQARWVGLDAFVQMLRDPATWHSLRVTLLFACVGVGCEMVLGVALALALENRAGRPLRGTTVFRALFILPMMVAPIAVGLVWRYLLDAQFGLVNALLGVAGIAPRAWLADPDLAFVGIVVADIWQWTPFVFIMTVAALANLDTSVIEAARIDGAGRWPLIWRVKLPMILDVLVVTLLMRLIDAFRVLEVVYVLTFGGPGDATELLSLAIYKTAFIGQRLGSASALSVLLLAVVGALSLLALRLSNPLKDEPR